MKNFRCSQCVFFKKVFAISSTRKKQNCCTYGLVATAKHGNSRICSLFVKS